jgi:putative endonuclease
MYYVYVLQSLKDKLFYTGFTDNLERRIQEHNNNRGGSTRNRGPFKVIYYEWCLNKHDAIAREKYLKSGMGKKFIRNRVKLYLESTQ